MAHSIFILDTNPLDRVLSADIDAVCQPEKHDLLVIIRETKTLEELAVLSGLYHGLNDARRVSLKGPVPWGLHLWGVRGRNFWVWNPHPPDRAPTVGKKRDMTQLYHDFIDAMGWWAATQ